MKKIIFILIIIIISTSAYTQEQSFKNIYIKMKEKYSNIYPKKFEAYIDGKIVKKQIDTIPSKSWTKTKNDIKLKFIFSQGSRPAMILENVDSFYRNMFSVFEDALETIGFYTLVGENSSYDAISKLFNFESVIEKKKEYEIKLRAKGENENYSINYTVNKDSLLIERTEYYHKKSKIYDIYITYEEIENYILPKTIRYKSSDGKVNSEIEFIDIKTFN